MSTAEQLAALSARLRNGGWDLRSPQELADIIADHIDAISQSTTPAQAPAQAAEPVKGTAGWLISELSKWPAKATVHGYEGLLKQFRVTDVFAAGDGNDGGDNGHAYLWLEVERDDMAALAAPHPSEPAATGRVLSEEQNQKEGS